MSPEYLVMLESGARVSSALILGVFMVVAVRTVVRSVGSRRGALGEELDSLREVVQDLGWQVDRLHNQQARRLLSLEQRVDFTEQMLQQPVGPIELQH
jgi:hypothetical protein